jgi:hypothetical protein
VAALIDEAVASMDIAKKDAGLVPAFLHRHDAALGKQGRRR